MSTKKTGAEKSQNKDSDHAMNVLREDGFSIREHSSSLFLRCLTHFISINPSIGISVSFGKN